MPNCIGKILSPTPTLLVSLESLGRHTVQMLHDVLDAFARMDLMKLSGFIVKIRKLTKNMKASYAN